MELKAKAREMGSPRTNGEAKVPRYKLAVRFRDCTSNKDHQRIHAGTASYLEVLYPKKAVLGDVFPYIGRIHTAET